ncbi:MAG: RNA 3'-terminal phosphate cyclase, partial [Rubripirellula sp.]
FYPTGGGKLRLEITPTRFVEGGTPDSPLLRGLSLLKRGKATPAVTGIVCKLPVSIAERELNVVRRRFGWSPKSTQVRLVDDASCAGNVLLIELESATCAEMFTGIGAIGVTAEQVARRTGKEAQQFLQAVDVPVGRHLADQILLPMGLAARFCNQTSEFRTQELTQHSLTQIELLQRFLEISIETRTDEQGTWVVVNSSPASC